MNEIKNTFGYRGEVNLELKVNDTVISISEHNKGLDILFKNILEALLYGKLANMQIATMQIKGSDIDPRSIVGQLQSEWIDISPASWCSARQYLADEKCAQFTATFSQSFSIRNNVDKYKYFIIVLNSQQGQNIAYFQISKDILKQFSSTSGSTLIVNWKLYVDNVN